MGQDVFDAPNFSVLWGAEWALQVNRPAFYHPSFRRQGNQVMPRMRISGSTLFRNDFSTRSFGEHVEYVIEYGVDHRLSIIGAEYTTR